MRPRKVLVIAAAVGNGKGKQHREGAGRGAEKAGKEGKAGRCRAALSRDRPFLERVEDGLYAAPNRIVPKAQRSKWRFAGKHWYEDLPAIPQERPDYGAAAEYLR